MMYKGDEFTKTECPVVRARRLSHSPAYSRATYSASKVVGVKLPSIIKKVTMLSNGHR